MDKHRILHTYTRLQDQQMELDLTKAGLQAEAELWVYGNFNQFVGSVVQFKPNGVCLYEVVGVKAAAFVFTNPLPHQYNATSIRVVWHLLLATDDAKSGTTDDHNKSRMAYYQLGELPPADKNILTCVKEMVGSYEPHIVTKSLETVPNPGFNIKKGL